MNFNDKLMISGVWIELNLGVIMVSLDANE
jgi:hypothetical protein